MTGSALSRIAAVVLMAAMLLAAAGCSSVWTTATHYDPIEGVVVSKQHTPAKTIHVTQCRPVGKVTVCSPQPRYRSAKWEITFEIAGSQSPSDPGKPLTRTVDVSQDTHDAASIGQRVVYDPNTKELRLLS